MQLSKKINKFKSLRIGNMTYVLLKNKTYLGGIENG